MPWPATVVRGIPEGGNHSSRRLQVELAVVDASDEGGPFGGGTDCHLAGDDGGGLLCTPPIMLAELVAAGHHRRVVTETMR